MIHSATRTAINGLTRMDKKHTTDLNYMTILKMDPMAECLTVNNMHTNKHVNLVQVKKIKAENQPSTISLDIFAGKCQDGNAANKYSTRIEWYSNEAHMPNFVFFSSSYPFLNVCVCSTQRTKEAANQRPFKWFIEEFTAGIFVATKLSAAVQRILGALRHGCHRNIWFACAVHFVDHIGACDNGAVFCGRYK